MMEGSRKPITRKAFNCPIFGHPKDLRSSKLPSYEEVIRCCFEEKYKLALAVDYTTVNFSVVADLVGKKVKSVFDKASIPTVIDKRIVQMINAYHKAYQDLKKSYNRDKDKPNYQNKLEKFKQEATRLFDVTACKCPMTLTCVCGKKADSCECPVSISCGCEKSRKIPLIELRFVYDQRNQKIGRIGQIDIQESIKLTKRLRRSERELERSASGSSESKSRPQAHVGSTDIALDEEATIPEIESTDETYAPSTSNLPSTSQMRLTLEATALACDRYGVSDRAAAAIASSVLHDIGKINESDMSFVIDKNKIRREKDRIRNALQCDRNIILRSLYFDGRKDETLVVETMHKKSFRRVVKEEHISLIQEPGSNYIGHVSPPSGTAEDISSSIISHLFEQGISLDELDVVGCDGTATNTGWRQGIIRRLELHLRRPLQWAVCLLHFNELPFRHLFQFLDGQTTGPKSFSGPIGMSLQGCENLPVVEFESIVFDVPLVDAAVLSKDQKYLYKISQAVHAGICPPDLAVSDPGPLSHSRWLTAANRILRLYISSQDPSHELKVIVAFILKCYMPVWFAIKTKSSVIDGPKHVFKAIQSSRYLPEDLLEVIDPVIQRNGFFTHPENLLIALVFDERKNIRELGLRRIIKARQLPSKQKMVRSFQLPTLNFAATDYSEMIDWNSCKLSSPPLLRNVSTDFISSLIESGGEPDWDMRHFPCHTQAVERCVKLVTEASGKVCGADRRDGVIRSTLLSREIMPEFTHKAEFSLIPKK